MREQRLVKSNEAGIVASLSWPLYSFLATLGDGSIKIKSKKASMDCRLIRSGKSVEYFMITTGWKGTCLHPVLVGRGETGSFPIRR